MSRVTCGRIKPGLGENDTIKVEGNLEVQGSQTVQGNQTNVGDVDFQGDVDITTEKTLPAFQCRAWVKFDGVDDNAPIFGSGNVSSVIRNDVGDFTINFTVPMPDANYCCVATCAQRFTGSSHNNSIGFYATDSWSEDVEQYLPGSVRVRIQHSGGSASQSGVVCVMIFR